MGFLSKNKSPVKTGAYLFSVSLSLSLSVFLTACTPTVTEESDNSSTPKTCSKCSASSTVNPNGSSELSVLMRNMYDSADSMKEKIKLGKPPGDFPEAFMKILTAQATDSNTKSPNFDVFANDYLGFLKKTYSSDISSKEERIFNYNMLVQKCVNCHKENCPGPLKKIRGLGIE